jgi:hypothetical protein
MKRIALILLLFTSQLIKSQSCLLVYDYMETYTWLGNWNTAANTGFYSNYSVSSNGSAAMFGTGNGSSAIEAATYVLPNVTGLNTAYAHKLTFRLGSYVVSNSAAATRGVDGADYVDVRYSTNNGVTAVTEMRIAGNANAFWNYNTATAAKTANGTLTTYAPTAGGDRTATGDGYSVIELTIPAGATQVAFNLNCRVNSAGEEWWIDNAELMQLGPCAVLPIELMLFEGINNGEVNVLTWITATELNNDHFTLYRSLDGYSWVRLASINGAGTVSTPTYYSHKDYTYDKGINYYKLVQINLNGSSEEFNIIYIDNTRSIIPQPIKAINMLGQEVDLNAPGLKVYYYKDGSSRLVIH